MPIPFSVPSLALPGKVAIITGGSTGMGRAMAVEFAKAGADIVVASRTVANLERVSAEVRSLGRRALAIRTDDTPETLARYPLGRIAEPIDIAWAALFLASDAANGITGQVLNVDCGASA